ncbi:hypothetical protein [Agromyces humi]|uniref:hypothetical protein n=1 Tax=Agromyces humi TaxID=1766800 RepID=UPI00135BD128|nr:hypothetical protein [Agromyces humi]
MDRATDQRARPLEQNLELRRVPVRRAPGTRLRWPLRIAALTVAGAVIVAAGWTVDWALARLAGLTLEQHGFTHVMAFSVAMVVIGTVPVVWLLELLFPGRSSPLLMCERCGAAEPEMVKICSTCRQPKPQT